MAKVVSDEILKLKIVVNGDEAQKRILDIEMANKKLSNSIDEERAKLKKLNANKAKNREEIERTKASIAKLTAEYDQNLRRIDEEIRAMDHMSLTTGQLKRRMDELAFTMRHMNPNDPNYKLAQDELAKLDSRYRQLRSGMGATAFSFKELSDKINQYSALITTAIVVTTAMVLAIQKAIDINNKLADAQSAVAKTTNLNIEQVRELTEAFEDFDTRTSKLDLLKIAEIGGRLGVAQDEILEFTREVDKIYVALGDGFSGGVEQVAELLGKLKGLYKETRDLPIADAMNQIGSAINELGAAGAASEENIAEFAKRIGSLPDSMRPSISEALALGAAFEESGIDAERSGTAYSTFVRIASRSTAKFAEVMKMSKEEVDKLINTNPMEFFLKFAEMAKGMEATQLAQTLDYLKLNDQYVAAITTAAADNMDRFRRSIQLSNEELAKATSLTVEFDKVNNNAAAIYDKIKKKFQDMYTSENVAKTLNWLIEKFGQLIGAIKDTDGTMTTIRETIIFLTKIFLIGLTAVVSYNTAIILTSRVFTEATARLIGYQIAQKAHNVITAVSTFVTNLYTASLARTQLAYARLTGNTALQTAAQAKLNLVTMANPFGALIAVVLAAAAAVYLFSKNTDEAAKKQKELNDMRAEAVKKVLREKDELQNLLAIAQNENIAKDDRLKAIKRLNDISPEYLKNLTLENMKTAEGTAMINNYIKALDRKAMAEVLSNRRTELLARQLDIQGEEIKPFGGSAVTWIENKVNRGNMKRTMSLAEAKEIDFMTNALEIEKELAKYVPQVRSAYKERREELKKNFKGMQMLNEEYQKFIKDNPLAYLGESEGLAPPPDDKAKKAGSGSKNTTKTQYQKDLEELQKLSEKYGEKNLDFAAEIEKRKIELMEEGFDREKMLLELESDEKVRNYEKQKVTAEEMAKLDKMIADTKDEKMKARLEEERAIWKQHNDRLTTLQTQETEVTNIKLSALHQKYITKSYKDEEEALKKHLELIEREKNERLALSTANEQKAFLKSQGYTDESLQKIRTWEEGRKEIENFYLNKRLTEQLDFLKKKVAEFNYLAQANPISLTPEQVDTIEEYKNKIAELVAEIAKLKNGDSKSDDELGGRLKGIGGGSTDILGLTPDQWDAMFTKTDSLISKFQKVAAVIEVMKNAFATYASFVRANEDAMLQRMELASEAKEKTLKKQLDAGIINQETYKKLSLENERELDKKKAEIAYNQAKRERMMAIASTIAGTASAVVGALGNKPWTPANFILAGLVGAMGAVQLATIMTQPLPTAVGAEEGLYPIIREQDGKMFSARRKRSRSGVYSEPTLLVGEGGASMPELVVSGRDLKRIDPDITRMFMRDIERVRGYENGMYPSVPQPVQSSGNEEIMIRMMAVLQENTEVMREIKNTGITAIIDKTARNGKNMKEAIGLFDDIESKNKH